MGCNWSDNEIPAWEDLKFKRFGNNKLNEYFTYIQRTFVSDLLELCSLIEKERNKLLKNLYMEELDLHYDHPYKPEIRDATLALFYAFNTHCDGNMINILDMRFFDTMPYVDLNVYKLSGELRNYWKEFCLYVGSLCDRERDLELLDEQYPQIYEDALSLCKAYYNDVTLDPYSPNVSSNRRVNYNIQQLRICRDCIKYCFSQINRDLKGIKDAIMEIKRTPKTMRRIATVCKVDNLTRPWECYTKIARLRNLNIVPHKETEYEEINEELNKDRIKKQKAKYQKLVNQQKKNDSKNNREKEEMDLLYDKIGQNFRKLPSLAVTKNSGDIKNKRELFKNKFSKIDHTEKQSKQHNPVKLIQYDFQETESPAIDSPNIRKLILEPQIGKDFEDIGILTSPVKSPQSKVQSRGKFKKKLPKKPIDNQNPYFNIFEPIKVQQQNDPIPLAQTLNIEPHINYAPNSFRDPDLQIRTPKILPLSSHNNNSLNILLSRQQNIISPVSQQSKQDTPFSQTPLGLIKRKKSHDVVREIITPNIFITPTDLDKIEQDKNTKFMQQFSPQQRTNDYVSFDF